MPLNDQRAHPLLEPSGEGGAPSCILHSISPPMTRYVYAHETGAFFALGRPTCPTSFTKERALGSMLRKFALGCTPCEQTHLAC